MAQRSNEPDLDLADLGQLSRSQLRDLWHREVGEQPPGSFGRELLALGIAYVRQERRYGGFRKASVREVDRLFGRTLASPAGETRRCSFPASPTPGPCRSRRASTCSGGTWTGRGRGQRMTAGSLL